MDLIKERVKIAVSDFSGKINFSYKGFEISDKIDIKSQTIKEIEKVLNKYSLKYKVNGKQKLQAIGIGVPATVDLETGKIINAPLFSGLRDTNLKETIEDIFNVPVYIENISKLSALAEKKYGNGKDLDNLIFIEISKGVGAGIIINGNLFRGVSGSAGEIGFMIAEKAGFNYIPKNEKGFLESKASTEAIIEQVRTAINKGVHTNIVSYCNRQIENINLNIIYKAYLEGDTLATNVFSYAIDLISISTINLILILNPEIIIIGGDICNIDNANEIVINEITKRVEKIVPFKLPEIKLSKLGENAGVIGASSLAIESLLLDEFPYFMEHNIL